jgi:DNA-binding PadR family transcriptional regulator
MSVKHGLLALLERGPMYGYQLRAAFEESTGGAWPLNIGQVYTTLGRLERDELVHPLPEQDGGQRSYEITAAGRTELVTWFTTPVSHADRPRDELAIKLALAITTPGVDVPGVLQAQRVATIRTLQEYTRLKAHADKPGDLPWRLVVEAMVFQAEAEARWLDHCETALARHAPPVAPMPSGDLPIRSGIEHQAAQRQTAEHAATQHPTTQHPTTAGPSSDRTEKASHP